MALFAALSWKTTPHAVRDGNRFSWAPMIEVAAVFLGVFVTMIPALSYLEQRGASLGRHAAVAVLLGVGRAVERARQRADVPDVRVARGRRHRRGRGVAVGVGAGRPGGPPHGQHLLAAVSCGSVMMGAVTYIGNGPNFMVKAIADQHRVRTPSFFGYVAWSGTILLPVFALVAHIFF